MKNLVEYVNEGILSKDFANKDVNRMEMIETVLLRDWHANCINQYFDMFCQMVADRECEQIYLEQIKDALKPIMDELEVNKRFDTCNFVLETLDDAIRTISRRFSSRRVDVPDYTDRVLKTAGLTHEMDEIFNKFSKKYKNASTNDIHVGPNVAKKSVFFTLSADLFDDIEGLMDTINKHKFSNGTVKSVRIDNDADLIVAAQIS